MANKHLYLAEGRSIDHTPASAITAGKLFLVGSLPVISPSPIAASALGGPKIGGVWRGPHTATIGRVGDNVWWSPTGTPVGGSADGALTTNAYAALADGGFWVGILAAPAAAADATCDVLLGVGNPQMPAWADRAHFLTAADLTMVEATHSGGVIHVTADAGADTKITLPTGVAGMEYIIQNDEADGGLLLQVDLDGNEIIRGANLTIAATKMALLTKATSVRGDYLHLVCTVSGTAWRCVAKRGIWVTS